MTSVCLIRNNHVVFNLELERAIGQPYPIKYVRLYHQLICVEKQYLHINIMDVCIDMLHRAELCAELKHIN